MKVFEDKDIVYRPSKQLNLYEYDTMFKLFINTINQKRLPKCSIFSGQKGLGKATFAYHLINYLLSYNEPHKYSIDTNCINHENHSYNLVNSNSHPNFFLIDNYESDDNIKIAQVRDLLKFLRNTTYEKNLKIVLIDNIDTLNLNAANALLKCLEEPTENTFFILVLNNTNQIIDTIKSRGIEFKFYLNNSQKKKIFSTLSKDYNIATENPDHLFDKYYFETPGNLINYIKSYEADNIDLLTDDNSSIFHLIDSFLKNGNYNTLSHISVLIEKFYNNLIHNSSPNNKKYFFNRTKILNSLSEMKNFNLDSKITFLNIKDILEADAR